MIMTKTHTVHSITLCASCFSLLLLLGFLPIASQATANPIIQQKIHTLLTELPGTWDGQAIITPTGPVNYDLTFYNCRGNLIAGTARTNASLHYWQFHNNKEGFQLRFLSTFAGNREPVWLIPDKTDQAALHFYAPKLKLLTVTVAVTRQDQVDINVFHYGKHHVHIRLLRDKSKQLLMLTGQAMEGSCRGTPE